VKATYSIHPISSGLKPIYLVGHVFTQNPWGDTPMMYMQFLGTELYLSLGTTPSPKCRLDTILCVLPQTYMCTKMIFNSNKINMIHLIKKITHNFIL
jgi:hypothetical protein